MRKATSLSSLIHTSEIKILLNFPSIILVLIFVSVKTLIMLILILEQTRGRPGACGHHVGDPWLRLISASADPIGYISNFCSMIELLHELKNRSC